MAKEERALIWLLAALEVIKQARQKVALERAKKERELLERKLKPVFQGWWENYLATLRRGVKGIRSKTLEGIIAEIADWDDLAEESRIELSKPILDAVNESAERALTVRKARHDPIGVYAVDWARHSVADLVKEINEATREGIRRAVIEFIEEGLSLPKLRERLYPLVGLTERQVASLFAQVAEARAAHPEWDEDKLWAATEKYAKKLQARRAMTIARTETAAAQNAGQMLAYGEFGIERVQWVADPECCEYCAANAGKVFDVFEAMGRIPLHPNCECVFVPVGVDPGAFGQATTIKEAEEHALSFILDEGGVVDFSKLDLSIANEINTTLKEMVDHFGVKPKFLGLQADKADAFFRKYYPWMPRAPRFRKRSNADVIQELNMMRLAPRSFLKRNKQTFLHKLRESYNYRWHPYDSVKGLMVHEYSHIVSGELKRKGIHVPAKFRELMDELKIKAWDISDYAMENYEEAFAELMGAYFTGRLAPGTRLYELAQRIERFILEALK